MADPLSVTASIAGLISLAGQLYNVLDTFISNIKDAPSLARTLHAEINGFRNSLCSFQAILSKSSYRPGRAVLIPAENVVVSIMDAVFLFSELESSLRPITSSTDFTLWERTQWTRKKSKLVELVGRLQWHKTTLILQLNILQCTSDPEAHRCGEQYCRNISEKLAQNRDLERRLELLEQQMMQAGSASILDTNTIRSNGSDGSDAATITADAHLQSEAIANLHLTNSDTLRDFEQMLMSSWVYRRNQHREEDMSFSSSVIRESAYSVLSQLSLADISVISVIALPIQLQELTNGNWYTQEVHSHAYTLTRLEEGLEQADALVQTSEFDDNGNVHLPAPAIDTKAGPATPYDHLAGSNGPSDPNAVTVFDDDNDDDDLAPPCKGCGEILEEGKAFELAGNRWHIECFCCSTCGTLLDADANLLLLGDGSLICNNCTYSCNSCGNKIEDLAILLGDQAFHASCFCCRNCKRKIDDLGYARKSQGFFCMDCHFSLMARRRKKKKANVLSNQPTNSSRIDKMLPPFPPNIPDLSPGSKSSSAGQHHTDSKCA